MKNVIALVLAAVAAVADARADAGEWVRATAECRPQMPSERTRAEYRQRKAEEEKARPRSAAEGEPYAEARAAAERTLGFALPADATWSTPYASEDERVEVVEFKGEDGAVNRFALFEQLGTKFPYWWAVEGTPPDALIAAAPAVSAADGVLDRDATEIIELNEELPIPYDRFRYWFLDDQPEADWIRNCRHLFAPADGKGFTVLYGRMRPRLWRKGTDTEILFAGESRAIASPDAQARMDRAAKDLFQKAALQKTSNPNPNLDYANGHPESSYFVLVAGGCDPSQNLSAFWADTAAFYSTLTLKYGVDKDHIFVFMSDGNSAEADLMIENGVIVDSPRDLDGDGEEDVDGPADLASITNCFANLAAKLRPTDRLYVFTTTHGNTIGAWQASNRDAELDLFSHGKTCETISDAQFSRMTKNIRCPMAVFMSHCFSGGFVDDVIETPNRVIATACAHFETGLVRGRWNWQDTPGKTIAHGRWSGPFIWALRGVRADNNDDSAGYPWDDSDTLVDADTNGDGMVSFREAAVSAEANNVRRCGNDIHSWRSDENPSGCYVVYNGKNDYNGYIQHPQYGESTEGLGDNFFVLNQQTTPRTIRVSPNGPNPEEAYLDPESGSSATAELTTTESWYTEVNPGASGWLSVTPSSGVGDCTVTVTATAANPNAERRLGFVKFFSRGGGNQMMAELQVAQGPRRPENDDISHCTDISGEAGTAYGTTLGATWDAREGLADLMGDLGATNTVWWRWIAPETKTVRFTTDSSSIDTVLGVFNSLDETFCDDDGAGGTASMVTCVAQKGRVYWICIAGKDGAEGDVQLNWEMFDDVKVTFDGNRGLIKGYDAAGEATNSIGRSFAWGMPLGYLPVLVEDRPTELYRGGGWWTERVGGEAVTVDTVPARDGTYYAHWIPRNDAQVQAAGLSGEEGSASVFNGNATLEGDDPMGEEGFGCTNTVWYSWTPEEDAFVCFDATRSTTTYGLPAGALGRTFSPVVEVIQVLADGSVAKRIGKGFAKMNVKGGQRCWIGVAGQTTDVPYGTINLEWYRLVRFTFSAPNGELPGTGSAHTNGSVRAGVPIGREFADLVPVREDKVFDGWWTAESGGVPVTADTTLSAEDDNAVFYAHWRPRPGNDLPAGAYPANPGEQAFDRSGTVGGSNVDASNRSPSRTPDPLADGHGAAATLWWAFDLRYAGVVAFDTKGSTSAILQGGELDTMVGVYRKAEAGEEEGLRYEELAFNDDGCAPGDEGSVPYGPRTSYVEVEVEGGSDGALYVGVGSFDGAGNVGDVVLEWKYVKMRVSLDPAGGCVESDSVLLPAGVPLGESLGDITPWREGYDFAGWRFANGSAVTEEAVITENHAFTAAWKPANDDFARAQSLNPAGAPIWERETENAGATVEDGEPLAAAWPDVTRTLWWSWTAPADGRARFATTNSVDGVGSEIDTVIGVYTGEGLGALVEEARGDDCESEDGVFHYWGMAEFDAVSGTVYRICVGVNDKDGRQVVEGAIRLSWTLEHVVAFDADGGTFAGGGTTAAFTARHGESVEPPAVSRPGHTFAGWFDEGGREYGGSAVRDATYYARWVAGIANDNFAGATAIGGASGSLAQSNDGATTEEGEPLIGCVRGGFPSAPHSLWWAWTAPADGTATFGTAGSTHYAVDEEGEGLRPYPTVLGVYTGSALDALAKVALSGRNTDEEGYEVPESVATFEAVRGTTYFIAVAGRYDTALDPDRQRTIVLNWSGEFAPEETLPILDENESETVVRTLLAPFADPGLDGAIGGDPAKWNDFAAWVNDVIGDVAAVKESGHSAASWLLGTASLLENAPTVRIAAAEVASPDDATTVTLTVTVKDGGTPVEVSPAKVAALVEATSLPGAWTDPETLLAPHAEPLTEDRASTVTIRTAPGDSPAPRAFLRIGN